MAVLPALLTILVIGCICIFLIYDLFILRTGDLNSELHVSWPVILQNYTCYRAWVASQSRENIQAVAVQGVPHNWRGKVWYFASGASELRVPGAYSRFLDQETSFERQINLDVPRTAHLQDEELDVLGRLLHAIAVSCPLVGYVQGLNEVVAMMIPLMEEEECFWTMIGFMKNHAMMDVYREESLVKMIEKFDFQVRQHKLKLFNSISSAEWFSLFKIFVLPWFVTMFTHNLPMNQALRLFDLFFLLKHGPDLVFLFGFAYLEVRANDLAQGSVVEAAAIFKNVQLNDLQFERSLRRVVHLRYSHR